MNIYFLDTDILVDLFKKRAEAKELINKLQDMGNIATSSLTVAELRSGWTKQEALFTLPFLYSFARIISVTQEIAEKSGELRFAYGKKGITLPTVDSLIAATCILNDCFLVTRNLRHYPMPEIKIFKM